MATRTTTKKAEPKTTTAKTAIEKEAPAKIPAETATVSAVKETMETAPAKKAAAVKKTTAKKTAEKKQTVRKTAAKKAASVNEEVYVQFWGKEVYAKDVVESIKKIWTEEMGKKESELKDLKVYIKPEDNGAHYVINGDITGFLGL